MHWHAFAYTGSRALIGPTERDRERRVFPTELTMWFTKPAELHKGSFVSIDAAYEWLQDELIETYPWPSRLPDTLVHHWQHLNLGQDAFTAFYGRELYFVRCLLVCPGVGVDAVDCPNEDEETAECLKPSGRVDVRSLPAPSITTALRHSAGGS